MIHPSTFYIRFLLVVSDDVSLDAINEKLCLHGISELKEEQFTRIASEMGSPPKDFRPWDTSHRISMRWLRDRRIFSIMHPDISTKEMKNEILFKPRVREKVEQLILGNVSDREAAFRLAKVNVRLSDLAIAEYRHYFWNTEIMGLSDWADYLSSDTTQRTRAVSTAYSAALHVGPELAVYRLGIKKDLESKKVMTEIQQELYHTFLETKTLPLSSKKVEMLTGLARSLAKIDERIQAGDTALQETLKKFEKFKVVTPENNIPSLYELAPTGSISDRSRSEIEMSKEDK